MGFVTLTCVALKVSDFAIMPANLPKSYKDLGDLYGITAYEEVSNAQLYPQDCVKIQQRMVGYFFLLNFREKVDNKCLMKSFQLTVILQV